MTCIFVLDCADALGALQIELWQQGYQTRCEFQRGRALLVGWLV